MIGRRLCGADRTLPTTMPATLFRDLSSALFCDASLSLRSVLDRRNSARTGPPAKSRSSAQPASKRLPEFGAKKCAWTVSNESFTVSPSWIRIRSFSVATISVWPACATRCVSEPVGSMRETRQRRPASGSKRTASGLMPNRTLRQVQAVGVDPMAAECLSGDTSLEPPSIFPSIRFIAGEPRKVATNLFVGLS